MSTATGAINGVKDYFLARTQGDAQEKVRIVLEVSQSAPLYIIDALKSIFVPLTGSGLLHIDVISQTRLPKVAAHADACIVVSGGDLAPELLYAAEWIDAGVPTCVLTSDPQEEILFDYVLEQVKTLLAKTQKQVSSVVADFLVEELPSSKQLTLAKCFHFCRSSVLKKLAGKVALSNAAIGLVDLIPGADFPAMFATEATFLAQAGSLYNAKTDYWRLLDLGAVLVWGVGTRSLTREAEKIPLLPKQLIRGGIALGSTYLLARAIILRYSAGSLIEKKLKGVALFLAREGKNAAGLLASFTGTDRDVEYVIDE